MKKFRFVDLFCGAGGATTGLIDALKEAGVEYEGVVVNHWNIAVQTHTLNHPEVKAVCASVEGIQADEVFEDRPMEIDCGWASPTCTHFSVARGGKPCSNQSRSQPEMILPYLRLTKVKRFYVENVPEFESWGPLLDKDTKIKGKKGGKAKTVKAGRPDPRKKGLYFTDWIQSIKRSGYRVQWRVLNAADFGAPTTRRRIIVQMVRIGSGEKIVWPEPSHIQTPDIFTPNRWRPAREIIDWSIPGNSIFARKTPLRENTLKRIAAGIEKEWGQWAKPFLIILRGTSETQVNTSVQDIDDPLKTVSAGGVHAGLVEPFIAAYHIEKKGEEPRTHRVEEPIPTLDCSNRFAVVSPFMVPFYTESDGQSPRLHSINEPLPTVVASKSHIGVIQPLFVPQHFQNEAKPVSEPLSTICTRSSISVVEPLFIPQHSAGTAKPTTEPLSAVATTGSISMIQPLFIDMTRPGFRHEGRVIAGDEPMRTVTTHNNFALATPLVIKYYGNEKSAETVNVPLGTVTTKDRFGLIAPQLVQFADGTIYALDILFRMLQPHELAAAMSFPPDYQFAGNKGDTVKQIGNAVCPVLSKALLSAALEAA